MLEEENENGNGCVSEDEELLYHPTQLDPGVDRQLKNAGAPFYTRLCGGLAGAELTKVVWLSTILLFLMMAFWLLCSFKDPIMSSISGVQYIPQAKIASLVVVLVSVMAYNKLLDVVPKHQLFTIVGLFYGSLLFVIAILLWHPLWGLQNSVPHRGRFLGWLSYVAIESFGSVMVQCFWALVSSSVDIKFAKNNFGYIMAGAQVGSILGPTLATNAEALGVVPLYIFGSGLIFFTILLMKMYISKFGVPLVSDVDHPAHKASSKGAGVMEGLYLFKEHNYVKGIFAMSNMPMIQIVVFDFLMKVLAQERYRNMYPDDPIRSMRAFASFMGHFGQATNSLSLLFSLCGTGVILQRFGLTVTLMLFPVMMLVCTQVVWAKPTLPVVFGVMMIIKGMNVALLNPTKEVLYQMTSSNIQYKCRSWIDSFGQRGCKALGAVITGFLAANRAELVTYGSVAGCVTSAVLIWCSDYMGRTFQALASNGKKVGEVERPATTP